MLKKSVKIFSVLIIILISIPLVICEVSAWKPVQHVGMGNIVLDDIWSDGKVTINGKEYQVNPLVWASITLFPEYYKMGCVGPDGYPDILFGQWFVHPDLRTDYSKNPIEVDWAGKVTYTYEWFDRLMMKATSITDYNTRAKAIAFTYGFMTHSAGDMFIHTFVNRYAGGSWALLPSEGGPGNALRHLTVEGYVNTKTGWEGSGLDTVLTEDEYELVRDDDSFNNYLVSTFIKDPWARGHVEGAWADFFGIFLDMESQVHAWLKEFDKSFFDQAWWAKWPVGKITKPYLERWDADIHEGLSDWIKTSSRVAYHLMFDKSNVMAIAALLGWVAEHALSMLGFPDIIFDLAEYVGDVADFIGGLLSKVPYVKAVWEKMVELCNKGEEWVINTLLKETTTLTLDEWKSIFYPQQYLFDTSLFNENNSPYGSDTKASIDAELANSLSGSSLDPDFDWTKFDATYNTVMMSKLMLLDGEELNKLLLDYNVEPLYDTDSPSSWSEVNKLYYYDNCAMRGWIKSLDGDHAWMQTAPDGKTYGAGMPLWDNVKVRERVFKKIFHFGPQVTISPSHMTALVGQPETLSVTIKNAGNKDDTIYIDKVIEGNGTFNTDSIPDSIYLNQFESQTFNVQYLYDGDEDFAGGNLTIKAFPSSYPLSSISRNQIKDWEPSEIFYNEESSSVIALKDESVDIWLTVDNYFHFKDWMFPILQPPTEQSILNTYPYDPDKLCYVHALSRFWVYGYSRLGGSISEFEIGLENSTMSRWISREAESYGVLYRSPKDLYYGVPGSFGPPITIAQAFRDLNSATDFIADGLYRLVYRFTDSFGHTSTSYRYIFLDWTPPKTNLTITELNEVTIDGDPFYKIDPETIFSLESLDSIHEYYFPSGTLYASGCDASYYSITEYETQWRWVGPHTMEIYYPIVIPHTQYTEPFSLDLPDGKYRIHYYATDKVLNREWEGVYEGQPLIIDQTPPQTNLKQNVAGAMSNEEYENLNNMGTPDSPGSSFLVSSTHYRPYSFELNATDNIAGVNVTKYRIFNEEYDSGWQDYSSEVMLDALDDGFYSVEYYSVDNFGNVEPTKETQLVLMTFSWDLTLQNTFGPGTVIQVNVANKLFHFTTLLKDYGIKEAYYVSKRVQEIVVLHHDAELEIFLRYRGRGRYTDAFFKDLQTSLQYP